MFSSSNRLRGFAARLVLTTATFGLSPTIVAAEEIRFPARSSDLAADSYWTIAEFGEGCCTLDWNVRRWNGSSWVGGTPGDENKDDFTWNVPIYAPANGFIASCWRNFPNNPKQGKNNKHKDYPAKIFTGGNHIVMITDKGNAITLAHLRQGSIPSALCPSNADGTTYPSTMKKEGAWRIASYITPANRPRVKEGDFVGRAGNSGNSSGPHLHMSVVPIIGSNDGFSREKLATSSSAPKFRHAWAHRFEANQQHDASGWYRLRGGEFSGNANCPEYQNNAPECKFKTLHPSPYVRRADKTAGAISSSDTLYLSSNRAVTAVVTASDGNLKLIVWDIIGTATINRKGDLDAGGVKSVHLSEPASDWVLAAVRLTDNRLKMIAFQITATGALIRRTDFTAGKVLGVDIATTRGPDRKTITAVRTEEGNLKLIAWDLAFNANGNVSIVRLGEAAAGKVKALAVARSSNFNGVFTAVKTRSNLLKLIPWKMSSDGKVITRGADADAGEIGSALDVAPLAQGVAAAVTLPSGNLRLVTWSVSNQGDIGARKETGNAGKVNTVKLLTAPNGGSNLTAAVRSDSANLILIGWAVDHDGGNLRRVGSSQAGAIKTLSADVISRSFPGKDPRDFILTSVRLNDNRQRLISWDANLNNP